MRFEWDAVKARENLRKHNVSFEEARSVFADQRAVLWFDHAHSDFEDRFLLCGNSSKVRFLTVSHCYPHDGMVRIISARKASSSERQQRER